MVIYLTDICIRMISTAKSGPSKSRNPSSGKNIMNAMSDTLCLINPGVDGKTGFIGLKAQASARILSGLSSHRQVLFKDRPLIKEKIFG